MQEDMPPGGEENKRFGPAAEVSQISQANEVPQAPEVSEIPQAPEVPACRHEYVRIYQRRLKGLDRRMVATRAYLPIGFKIGDFGHLGENSYCFCTKCRARLYPKRTAADRLQARLAAAAGKLSAEQSLLNEQDLTEDGSANLFESSEAVDSEKMGIDIHVEELEPEGVDVQDITAEGVNIEVEDSCALSEEN
jgi:hypothetical protein